MKLLIDLQACQSESKFRGIGRGSLSLAIEMISLAKERNHEILVLLNQNFPKEFDHLQNFFLNKFPNVKIVPFRVPSPCSAGVLQNQWRLRAAEILREYLIASIAPDYVHVSTLLADGWGDDCVASINELGVHIPTALTQYDLIPLVMEREYMHVSSFRSHYLRKLESVKSADLLLAISEYSRREVIERLGFHVDAVINISSAVENDFHWAPTSSVEILNFYGLKQGYLLYVPGGFDPRKNLGRLIEAYAGLPAILKRQHPLVIASKVDEDVKAGWYDFARKLGVFNDQLLFTDYVPDDHLKCLYANCHAYIFPSLHEGFGLPILEAMVCGAPVIGSNVTGIPEVIGLSNALFNPYSVEDIRNKLHLLCTDLGYLKLLTDHSKIQPKKFSWKRSAELAINSIEKDYMRLKNEGYVTPSKYQLPNFEMLKNILSREFEGIGPTDADWGKFKHCFDFNLSHVN